MSNTELVSNLFKALEEKNYEKAKSFIHDDFKITGPFPEPFGKEQWIESTKSLQSAFPDWSFNPSNITEEGERVNLQLKISGTHRGELKIPEGPTIPPTNKSVSLPEEGGRITVKDGMIHRMEMEVSSEGGLKGIIKQLGVEMPQ